MRVAAVPIPWGLETASTSRAARAAARLATSESVDEETPSHTTSTAWLPGSDPACRATASSLRVCRTPRSQTAATHGGRLLGEVVAQALPHPPRTCVQ